MTNSAALFIALAIVAFVAGDVIWNDAAMSLFLGRKFTQLLDWLAFWR